MSYVRALGSRTLHFYQVLSCLWWHNNTRMIIFLAWFHNLFLWDLCHFKGNWSKQTVLKYYSTDSPKANPYFLPLIYQDLTRFGRSYLNSCCSLGTTIQTEKHQQLKYVTFIPSFSHSRICGSKWKNNFSFEEKISTFYAFHPWKSKALACKLYYLDLKLLIFKNPMSLPENL